LYLSALVAAEALCGAIRRPLRASLVQ
jgi:hypothetical protein